MFCVKIILAFFFQFFKFLLASVHLCNVERHSTGLVKKGLEEPLDWSRFFISTLLVVYYIPQIVLQGEKIKGHTDI